MMLQEIRRHIKLMPGNVLGKGVQQPRDTVRNARRQANSLGFRVGKNLSGKSKQRRGCSCRVGFEIVNTGHRVVVEVEAMRLNQIDKLGRRELMAFHCGKQRRSDGISARLIGPFAADDVAPPLQADFAGQCRVRHLAHARHLGIESINRVQRAAKLRRREQRGDEPIPIGSSDQLGTVGEHILHAAELSIQSTAIRPAPTRRLSISITL